jgi:hypothetical protein
MKLITFACALLLFSSCASVKVMQVQSDLKSTTEGFVFENDTVKITYHFWEESGRMQFDIYNKLGTPLYVDWKTSAYIPNDKMVSYWRDETNTEAVSSGYYYKGLAASSSKMKAIRIERIGVIPPESMITQSNYTLVKKTDKMPDKGNFIKNNSPLRFRSYVMIAGNEKFEGKVTAINNSFYISLIKTSNSNKYTKYKSPTWFYISG